MTEPPSRLRAILFDFDGTIAQTERSGHRVAYNAAFAEAGLDWTWDDARYGELLAISGGKERIAHYLEQDRPPLPNISDRARFIADLHARKARIFAGLAGSIALRPGVVRLVREAREAGIVLAIATTAAPTGVDAVLSHEPALRDAFATIAAGDIVAHKKPAPDIYRYVLDALRIDPREAVAIEDSAIGVQSSRAAGLATLVTVSDYTHDEDFTGAQAILSDLGEPAAPARTLAGPTPPGGFADLAYLRALLASAARRAGDAS